MRRAMMFRSIFLLALYWPLVWAPLAVSAPPPAIPTTPTASGSGQRQEVEVEREFFGVGGVARPGEFAGVRLALTDSAPRPRDVAVQLHIRDADGDAALYQRLITLNPGEPMGVWLYARMPWTLSSGQLFTVTVRQAEAGQDGRVEVGRTIGATRITPQSVRPDSSALFGVIGRLSAGIDQYGHTPSQTSVSPAAHEPTLVVTDLSPVALSDDWKGLAAFEVLLWTDADPETLGVSQSQAIIEWVNRGGHLVIVIPSIANPWASPRNPLAELLPRAEAVRVVDASLRAYANFLIGPPERDAAGDHRSRMEALPAASLHRFVIPTATEIAEATPLLSGPHGVIAVRRLVGTGMVTLIGIDLTDQRLRPVLRGDAVWSRILGKRADTPSFARVERDPGFSGWSRRFSTQGVIDSRIAQTLYGDAKAHVAVLVGLVIFVLYWLIAGPVGFAALRARGMERHAWVAFVLSIVVFTAMAWAGASYLRPKRERVWHYSLLDHVYGQPVQRIRSFFTVLLPRYGDEQVTLGTPGADAPWRQALTPFINPAVASGVSFPDARPYTIDVRDMTSLVVPARSTIKSFHAEWLGGPRLAMPRPRTPEEAPELTPDRLLKGVLTHDLPGGMMGVRVIVVTRQTSEQEDARAADRNERGRLRAVAYAGVKTEPALWEAGEPLDLALFSPAAATTTIDGYLDALVPRSAAGITLDPIATLSEERLDELISLFSVLRQPDYVTAATLATPTESPAILNRRMTHAMDLAKWFTQPCLIIIGHIDGAVLPFPASVDGRAIESGRAGVSGRTVIRWVYPLRADPPVFRGSSQPGAR